MERSRKKFVVDAMRVALLGWLAAELLIKAL
jgi:hypothetical protein